MYSDIARKKAPRIILILAAVLIVAAAVFAFAGSAGKDVGAEAAPAIQEVIQKAALQCYAVEGVYPPDLAYLQDHYGLSVNTEDFIVVYDAFASNLPPTVFVTSVYGNEEIEE